MVERTLTVQEVAERYSVDMRTVARWISSGELRAISVSRKPGSRKPRWRITPEAILSFELLRSSGTAPTPTRRRKHQPTDVIEFYK